jgi:GntR family transcriptional regulator
MLIALDSRDRRPLYVQIMDEIRRALALGTLSANDAVPSVRQLAVELRINPNTVSQAYRELEREGVLEARRGQGTYVARRRVSGSQRSTLAGQVATRALQDAHRNGLDVDDLIDALRSAAALHRVERAR